MPNCKTAGDTRRFAGERRVARHPLQLGRGCGDVGRSRAKLGAGGRRGRAPSPCRTAASRATRG
jgi:hypothetical protein